MHRFWGEFQALHLRSAKEVESHPSKVEVAVHARSELLCCSGTQNDGGQFAQGRFLLEESLEEQLEEP